MTFIAYLLGFLVRWIVYIIAAILFGDAGFMFYLGTFLSSALGAYLGSIIVGKIQARNGGDMLNFFIPILFFMTILGGIIGIIRNGFGGIWEYLVTLVGLFIAFGFFNMYIAKSEKR